MVRGIKAITAPRKMERAFTGELTGKTGKYSTQNRGQASIPGMELSFDPGAVKIL